MYPTDKNRNIRSSQRSIKDYTSSSFKSNKRLLSSTSPTEEHHTKKLKQQVTKAKEGNNKDTMDIVTNGSTDGIERGRTDKELRNTVVNVSSDSLEGALGPLVHEIKLLRESFDEKYSRLDDKYTKLENVITSQRNEVSSELVKLNDSLTTQKLEITATVETKIGASNEKLEQVLQENRSLKRSNMALQERLSRIEATQLDNNVILTGIQEEQWERYEITHQRVIDIIAEAIKPIEGDNATIRVRNVLISNCKRIGTYRMNYSRPISIAFQRKEDKDLLMSNKQNLPAGIYANDEYPIHVKLKRDKLRPILRLAKTLPEYKDNTKLIGDKLIINGVKYSIDDIHMLPAGLEAYRAAEKNDANTIAFHGELSPYSNFHPSPFIIGEHSFHSTEQWIQYQKSLMFGDSYTANLILQTDSAIEAKRLSHKITGVDHTKWKLDGYEKCVTGIMAKFDQNPFLKLMLLSTKPKLLVEASTDKLWGTGVGLRDTNVLKRNSWTGQGWLSKMLHQIRDDTE